LKRQEEQKKQIDGFDALKEALLNTVAGANITSTTIRTTTASLLSKSSSTTISSSTTTTAAAAARTARSSIQNKSDEVDRFKITTTGTTDSYQKRMNLLKSTTGRQKLNHMEITQMALVLQHPAFQADPLSTIREHLQNTLIKDKEILQKQAIIHTQVKREQMERKKIIKKENGISKRKTKFRATRSKKAR
jgi:ABC-type dipeptide/oligopeptide/nickel transport system ATPase component